MGPDKLEYMNDLNRNRGEYDVFLHPSIHLSYFLGYSFSWDQELITDIILLLSVL